MLRYNVITNATFGYDQQHPRNAKPHRYIGSATCLIYCRTCRFDAWRPRGRSRPVAGRRGGGSRLLATTKRHSDVLILLGGPPVPISSMSTRNIVGIIAGQPFWFEFTTTTDGSFGICTYPITRPSRVAVMASLQPKLYALQTQAFCPCRGSDPESRMGGRRHRLAPSLPAAAAAGCRAQQDRRRSASAKHPSQDAPVLAACAIPDSYARAGRETLTGMH